ncbi:branched-subunit amino acid transport protein [Loktanella ponticola]|uniref:Branched-subunit amino acid transport protein n=1 Tax=Yoonia ponticola TaxID=1524255 RepID=A0A7W9F086_9RHOB|nr:AzlD domain-containing protein [Yoonia ponticola]MBB5722950.1 branched-subunit amino acid transport protein [Yoonia ponticola]
MTFSNAEIWLTILLVGVGTYVIRFSFLGLIGDRPMPAIVLRLLRYTPVAVLPAMVAPLALWPDATGGDVDPVRVTAALATLAMGVWKKHVLWAIGAGAVTLYAGLYLTGQL